MDNRVEANPGGVFTAPLTGEASLARIRQTIDELRESKRRLLECINEQAHTLHQLRAAVEPFADNLREMLGRLEEILTDGQFQYGTGYLEGSTPCILSKLTELLDILGIDSVDGDSTCSQ